MVHDFEARPVVSESDIKRVSEMAWEIQHDHYDSFVEPEIVEYLLKRFQTPEAIAGHIDSGAVYFIIYSGGIECGYFALTFEDEAQRLFLSKLYLYRHARGKKIASRTLEMMKKIAKERRLNSIKLIVNEKNPSITAYEAMGFIITEYFTNDIGNGCVLADCYMELKL